MALTELRNISASSYFVSTASLLPVLGGDSSFTAAILVRENGPTSSTQWICGNVNGLSGWSFVRLADSNNGATHNYTFTVYENAVAQTLSFAIPASVAKMMLFHCAYAGGAPGAMTVYVNGVEMLTAGTTSAAITASTGRFSIGYNFNAGSQPNPDMGFVAFGYVNTTFTAQQIADNTLAITKAQEVSNGGLSTSWQFLYSVSRDSGSGVPSVLRNFGTNTNTLTVTGRTALLLSSPPAFLGDSVRIQSSGGGGDVSGPGVSTNNAVATWDGILGDTLQNSLVLVDPPTGDITTPGTVNGRDIAADGAKLDTIATGATNTPLSAVAPVDVTKSAAAVGVAVTAARADHKHDITTAAAGTITIGATAAEGSATSLARSDHTHALPAPAAPVNVTKAAASAGVATTAARADHKHDVTTAAAVTITDSTNAEGSSSSLARADHTHAHGTRGGGTLHALVTTSVAGFMSASDKVKLDSIPGGGTGTISDVYVSAVNGNDANTGASPAAAVATLARALELVPSLPTGAVIIHFGSGAYAWTDVSTFLQGNNAPVYLWGDGAGQPGDTGFNVVATGTVVGGSTATTIVTSAPLPSTNSYAGYTLEMTSGPTTGARKTIRNNTTSNLVLCSKLSAVPSVGNAYQVKQSDVHFILPEGGNIGPGVGYSQTESPLVLININFQGTGFESSLRVSSTNLVCYGVTFDEGGLTCVNSNIHAGTLYADATNPYGAFGNFLPFQGALQSIDYLEQQLLVLRTLDRVFFWEGWGLSTLYDTDEQLPLVMDSGHFVGFLVGSQLTISPAAKVALVGGSILDNGQTTSGQIINNGGYLRFQTAVTQRSFAGAVDEPGIAFYLFTGSGGKTALQVLNGGYTRVDGLDLSTNNASTSLAVIGVGSTFYSTNLANLGATSVSSEGSALFQGTLTTVARALTVSNGRCVFDGPTDAWLSVTVSNNACVRSVSTAGTFAVASDVVISGNSLVEVLSYFDFNGSLTVTDSELFIRQTSGALTTVDLGTTVSLTNSYVNIDAYPNTIRVNNGGSATATVLSLNNSTFRQNGFQLTITGRVLLNRKSTWMGAGAIGTSTTGRISCFGDSNVNFVVTGTFSCVDTAAPSLTVASSTVQFFSDALTIGNSVDAEVVLQDQAKALLESNTGAITVTGNVTLTDSSLTVSDATAFNVSRSMALTNAEFILRDTGDANIGTGFSANASRILQVNCKIDVEGGVTLARGTKWIVQGPTGATSTWNNSTGAGLSLTQGSVFDMSASTGGGSFVFDADAPLTPVTISTNSIAYFRSANIDIAGAPALAAMSLTFGGGAYFIGALSGFTAAGDDFSLDGNTAYTFTDVNTSFGLQPGGPLTNFYTPGSPSIVQCLAFIMRIS